MALPKAAQRLASLALGGQQWRGGHPDAGDEVISSRSANVESANAEGVTDMSGDGSVVPEACRSVYRSSLGVPFIVVSETELVEDLPALSSEQFQDLLSSLYDIVDALEAERVVLLADFEGEMTGFGGELVTAAFLPTTTLEREALQARRSNIPRHPCEPRAGLLLDLRCEAGRRLVRRLMESEAVAKVIWGADGDLTSLRHQVFPAPLQISSRAVVDAQLAFSPPYARIGMARMLERVPKGLKEALPAKASVEFDLPHSANRRALRWPLQAHEARYAADDLHRLEAILQSQNTPNGAYLSALNQTAEIMARIEHDPYGLAWLGNELGFFSRKPPGTQRRAKAVQLVRHIKTLPARMANPGAFPPWVAGLEAELVAELANEGVVIPNDVSFAN